MSNKLNLAIVLDNEEIFLWQYRILEKLINCDYANIKLFLINDLEPKKTRNTPNSLYYKLHEKLDRFIFRGKIDFDEKIKVLKRFGEIPVANLSNKQQDGKAFQTNPIDVHKYSLDLLLNFRNSTIQTDLVRKSRFGVLTYNISKQINQTDAPSCYWEVVKRMPEIEVSIQLDHPDRREKTEIFHTGILPYPNSININRDNLFELASLLIPRIIEGIYFGGNTFIVNSINKYNKNDNLPERSEHFQPSSFQAFSNLVLLYFNFLRKKISYHKIGRWFIIFKTSDVNNFLHADPGSFKILKAPKNKFWADPFVVSHDDFHYIFIEEYLYKTDKGHISVLTLNDKGDLVNIETIIEKPYHMSYPNIFKYNESYYMIPETGSNNTIELYSCTDFPNEWKFVKNLMENITAKDTTLFFFNNKWWLFTSIIERNNATISFNELFLYYSDDLFSSNWQSHPMNPIVSDLKLSRPAGKIFISENKIYRPSQDCSGIYGRALNICCITKLSETEYEEVLISKTEPIWDKRIKGIHTYNFDEKITVMDAFSLRNRIGV